MIKPSWMPLTIEEASELLGVERRHLGRTIAPVMAESGAAWQAASEHPWYFNAEDVRQWANFLRDRQRLIADGVWSRKRKYSVGDYISWCAGELDAVVDSADGAWAS